MSEETVVNKLSTPDGMTVKIGHYQEVQSKINLKTGSSSSRRIDHYEFILESTKVNRKKTAIPKRLYVALRALEIDPKF